MEVVPVLWDGTKGVLDGLDKPSKNNKEANERAKTLGMKLYKASQMKEVEQVGDSTAYLVYLWGKVPADAKFGAWKQVGDTFSKHTFEDVTSTASTPKFTDQVGGLGKPTRVLKLTTTEKVTMVSLQVSRDLVKELTYVLICPDDNDRRIYPGKDRGLWIDAGYLKSVVGETATSAKVPMVVKAAKK